MSRPNAPACPTAAQPNAAVAASAHNAPFYGAHPRPSHPPPMPFAGQFRPPGVPPPAPYRQPFYPVGRPPVFPPVRPPVFPPVRPPVAFPRPPVYLPPTPPPGGFIPRPGPPFNPVVYPRHITQYPVYQQPLGFPPRPTNPPTGFISHQRPAVINGTFGPVSVARPPVPQRPTNPPIGFSSHQRPAVIGGTFGPVTLARPPIAPIPPRPTNPAMGFLSHQRPAVIGGTFGPVTVARPPIAPIPTRPTNPAMGSLLHQRPAVTDGTIGPVTVARPPIAPIPTRPSNPAMGFLSHQRPAVTDGTFGPVTVARPPMTPVAPADETEFRVFVGKIASSVDSDFILSLLQVCGVVKTWNPVINPIDGTRTAFGFCDFESVEGSLRAWRLLNKMSIDGQELVLNVNEAMKAHLQIFGENTTEENAKEAETETRDGMGSLADNGNDSSIAIPDLKKRGAVVGGQMSSQGKTKRCRYSTEEYSDSDKEAMQKICIMIEDRMKSKFPCLTTPPAQLSASIIDEKCDNGSSSALEDGEVSPVGSSMQIDAVPSMHVSMEWESTVEHERKRQHSEREFCMNSDEEKGSVCLPGLGSDKHNSNAPGERGDLESQAASKSGNEQNLDAKQLLAAIPKPNEELGSDKHNSNAPGEKGDLESQAASKSGNEQTLDAKQLLAAIPKTKEELFAYDIEWAICDKHGLHEKMRPWISEKTTEIFGEEIPEFVEYVVASTKEHVEAPRMLEALASLMDHSAEKFALSVWTKLIFEIKKAETGLA